MHWLVFTRRVSDEMASTASLVLEARYHSLPFLSPQLVRYFEIEEGREVKKRSKTVIDSPRTSQLLKRNWNISLGITHLSMSLAHLYFLHSEASA